MGEIRKLEEQVVVLLLENSYTITTVESCTAGLLSSTIVNVSGSSRCFNESYVTYSNEAKERLAGVSHATLEQYGAVSEETAREMAQGGASMANANVALSVTGIAGPTGGTKDKPVGLVYIGCCVNEIVEVIECQFHGTREENRKSSVEAALKLAINVINNESMKKSV